MASRLRDGSSEVRSGGGDDADTEARRQGGQRRVAFVVERMAVVGQLDADPVGAEPVHQIGQRPFRRVRTAVGKRLAYMAFAASGQDVPVPARGLGQRIEVDSAACPSRRRPDAPRPAAATAAGSLPGRGPAPADAGRADPAPRCGQPTPATVRRRTRCACRAPRPLRRTAPPRTGRRGRSVRGRADPAGRPPRPAPPACWPRRGSCTPNARAARRTRRTSGSSGCRPAAHTSRACATRGRPQAARPQPDHPHGAACRRAPAPFPPNSAAH